MSKKRGVSKVNPLTMEPKEFRPLTQTQAEARNDYVKGKNLFLCGYAGTGKTFVAISMAIDEIQNGTKERLCIFRSSVSSRDMGFLPGDQFEKMAVYEAAYPPIVNSIFGRDDAWQILKTKGVVSFESTSFLRGTTLNDCVIVVDEVQNCTASEINTILTRVGKGCRVILCGDHRQSDLPRAQSGFKLLMRTLEKMNEHLTIFEFDVNDIVRSDFVKAWIIAYDAAIQETNHQ